MEIRGTRSPSLVLGDDVYVARRALDKLAKEPGVARCWLKGRRLSTVRRGKVSTRAREPFKELTDDELGALVETTRSHGFAPSSMGGIFRQHYDDKGALASVNAPLREHVRGPCMLAVARVARPGAVLCDINSAYYWSAIQGLPDPATYRPALLHNEWKIALASVCIHPVGGPYPYPFEPGEHVHLVTREECDAYNFDVRDVIVGVTWTREESQLYVDRCGELESIYGGKVGKRIRQSFWGAWQAARKLKCQTRRDGVVTKEWEMPPRWEDAIRAHIVQSRIRIRLYEAMRAARGLARIYVDSVIAEEFPFPFGVRPGDWRIVRRFPDGVKIVGAGCYVDAGTGEVLAGKPTCNPIRSAPDLRARPASVAALASARAASGE